MAFQGYTMPPPYNGLDLVSAIDNMEPTYALELVNVFPGAGSPTLRNGYAEFVAPMIQAIQELNQKVDEQAQLIEQQQELLNACASMLVELNSARAEAGE